MTFGKNVTTNMVKIVKQTSHTLGLIMLFLASLKLYAAPPSNWSISADVGSFYDSNVGKAKFQRDTVADEVLSVNGRLQYKWQPTQMSLFTVSGLAETELYDTLDTLNSTAAGVEFGVSWQNRFGFLAPFYRASLTFKHKAFDSEARTTDSATLQIFVTQRLTTDFTGRLGYQLTEEQAGHVVFDKSEHRLFGNIDYIWSKDLVAYFTASLMQGDIYSVAQATFCNGLAADDILSLIHI